MMNYDVAIVGTGPSAASAFDALKRNRPTLNICLLEAGSQTSAYSGNLDVKASERFRLDPSIYVGPGGTSELWHHVLAPLDEIDFEPRPEIGNPGWGISLSDLKPFYENALRVLGISETSVFWEADSDSDIEALKLSNFLESFEPKLFIQLKKRWKSIQFLRDQGAEIRYNHFVKSFELTGDLVHLNTVDGDGKINPTVAASKLIICAGGLNTPQIVFNSSIDDAVRRNVGKTLLDHPMGVGMQLKRDSKYNFEILTSKKTRLFNKKVAFRLKECVQREQNLPNSSFYFKPSFREGYSEYTENLKSKVLTYRQHIKKGVIPLNLTFELAKEWNLVAQIIQYKTGLLSKTDLFDIFCVTEQISRDSSIDFRKNEDGYYIGYCRWGVDSLDQQVNNKILKKFEDWIASEASESRVTVRSQDVVWMDRAVSAAHHIGTVPMSQEASRACVDQNCAILNLDQKVFVADASVMPSSGCANVTLTSMAIANRTGEYVARTL